MLRRTVGRWGTKLLGDFTGLRAGMGMILNMGDGGKGPEGFGRFTREKKETQGSGGGGSGGSGGGDNNNNNNNNNQPEEDPKNNRLKISAAELEKRVKEEIVRIHKEKKEKGEEQKHNPFGANFSRPTPDSQQSQQVGQKRGILPYIVIGGILLLFLGGGSGLMGNVEDITIDRFFSEFIREGKVNNVIITRSLDSQMTPIFKVNFRAKDSKGEFKEYAFPVKNLEYFMVQLKSRSTVPVSSTFANSFADAVREKLDSLHNENIMNLIMVGILFFGVRMMVKGIGSLSRQGKFDEKNNMFINRLKSEALKKGTGTKISFKDVAGMEEAKKEITEFVDFLTNKEQYLRLGATIPRGALLTGPPGTGKTLLAKACANESKVPFLSVPGSEFVEIYGGVGASRVRALFEVAREHAPCIIFIDEIDAIGKKRSGESAIVSNSERENTLNQLLVEMDGFGSQSNVVVFAATNMKDSLDPALLRPGRFDRIIDVPLPDIEARKKIFMVHLGKITIETSKKLEEYANRLATLTPAFSGAQIENVCNEAAIIAARKNASTVTTADFEQAVERVIAGLEKKNRADEENRRLVAINESAHGVVSWFLKNGPPLLKLTIVPRSKGKKGFAQYLTNENFLNTRQDLIDSICIALAGIIAEERILGKRTMSSADDLKNVEKLAHQLVTTFGMSELGPVQRFEKEWGFKSYSEHTNAQIDQEKIKIVKECEEITRKLIEEKLSLIKTLSEELLKRETLTFREIEAILGKRPFPPKRSFKQYLDEIAHEEETKQKDKDDQPRATAI